MASMLKNYWLISKDLIQREFFYKFVRSPITVISFFVFIFMVVVSLGAELFSPHPVFDIASLNLSDAFMPPAWDAGGSSRFLLGTDGQGRGILSVIIYGTRLSLTIAFFATILTAIIGVTLGVCAGYLKGKTEIVIMRITDIQFTIPAIMVALMLDGVLNTVLSATHRETYSVFILIFVLGTASWPVFCRVSRAATMVEVAKDYITSAKIIGLKPWNIMLRHVFPNILRSLLVLATLDFVFNIIAEATLSFLGVGMPPTMPSLGSLVRIGNNFIFSGEWWIILFPALTLVIFALSVNLLSDWLRDALNPRLNS